MSILNPYKRFEPVDIGERKAIFALCEPVPSEPVDCQSAADAEQPSDDIYAIDLSRAYVGIDDATDVLSVYGITVRHRFMAQCRSCGQLKDICFDLKDFDESEFYCGASERCIP